MARIAQGLKVRIVVEQVKVAFMLLDMVSHVSRNPQPFRGAKPAPRIVMQQGGPEAFPYSRLVQVLVSVFAFFDYH